MKKMLILTSAIVLIFFLSVLPLAEFAYAAFPFTTNQLGEHGHRGVGGKGGAGGTGGAGGKAGANPHGTGGGGGGLPTSLADFGGDGGDGILELKNMAPGDAFINQGILKIGGDHGLKGKKGKPSVKGGNGGAGGGVLCSPAAEIGKEPSPDNDPTQQGGVAGTVFSEGGAGSNGGGGGGGRCSAPFVGGGPGGKGGDGVKGEDGAGGTGADGANETIVMTTGFTSPPGSTLQIGGNGGQGGNQGQIGGGGGGGGGAGESWGNPRGLGGQGYNRSYEYGIEVSGGMYGGGYLRLYDGGRIINQGTIELSTNCTYEWGYCILSYLSVWSGGFLINDESGIININKEGNISTFYEDSTIVNNGLIDNYYSLSISGNFSGSGTIDGGASFYDKFMPGNSIGFHTINGYYGQKGTLQIEIGGKDHTIPEYDYVAAGSWVELTNDIYNQSELELVFVAGFTEGDLAYGDYFDVIRYPSTKPIDGTFASVNDTQAPLRHGFWALGYDEEIDAQTYAVQLTYQAPCMCDVDQNHVVDGKDLATFTAAYNTDDGSPDYNPECDLNGDGHVDQLDLNIFSVGYGKIGLDPPICPAAS